MKFVNYTSLFTRQFLTKKYENPFTNPITPCHPTSSNQSINKKFIQQNHNKGSIFVAIFADPGSKGYGIFYDWTASWFSMLWIDDWIERSLQFIRHNRHHRHRQPINRASKWSCSCASIKLFICASFIDSRSIGLLSFHTFSSKFGVVTRQINLSYSQLFFNGKLLEIYCCWSRMISESNPPSHDTSDLKNEKNTRWFMVMVDGMVWPSSLY